MLITTLRTPELQDLIKKSFVKGVFTTPGDVRKIFIKVNGDNSTKFKRIDEVDSERFAKTKPEAAPANESKFGIGYHKVIQRKTIADRVALSYEELDALTAHQLKNDVMNVGYRLKEKIELDMAHIFTFGQSASYTDNGGYTVDTTTGDGLPIFSTAHTLKFSTKTYSNILAGNPSLSFDSLVAAQAHIRNNSFNNFGHALKYNANTIITTSDPVMVNRVARILQSSSVDIVEGTQNANAGIINPLRGRYKHYIVDFDVDAEGMPDTSKSYWWFLAATDGMPGERFQAYYVSWKSPTVYTPDSDKRRLIMGITGEARYGIGVVSGRGIVASFAIS